MENSKIIEKNKNSIILIEVFIPEVPESEKGKLSVRGTGFIISPDGQFITCAHVYNQLSENEKKHLRVNVPHEMDSKGITHYKRYGVELLKLDNENDVALMKIVDKNSGTFSVISKLGNSESVSEGDEVIFLGYPLATELLALGFGITMTTNSCIISSVKRRGIDGSLHFFLIDTHTNNGSSGSPVFLKSTGEIIGIVSGRISQKVDLPDRKLADIPANLGICRPINYIKGLIK
ncbi:hypothetical protein A2757_03080 [Candidatus Giovannonibacteria bacterium RIFCSPHIGHO2_01_FULL_48_47]|nr:MAG: hypothetical protein A2757_03080 [Candidatus Giovannonibacteria bacterium RIFCSPHIGHO2_01_FULL_48_47]OGF67879.1 MAG: hypothetical protein A3D61_02160 [Candidatus Giovannonibacteria bacterium RIFCSPHIGHO2_02_FULL_48_15]OGF88143.1 MAG: hypothetical protein A3B26_00380 [Candidatus Giovannonibacteria bacterium RIFCSPLOWO2_01_FULL_48_47]OGF94931.1 MAG: hypothetical protein A2433_01625 [Candidatus Giovannonibacteria bacterium RIFOXYC1_FULL_48_8]OGF96002.1 MAG: hypothetical protein A2613_00310